ncbi:MAG: NAD(P)H-hydrate dehydratase, partial [Planctomycetota bacterium]
MSAPPGLPPLPPRPADAHKGSCGRVLVVGGCQGYPGAPLLAARAAFESGAGYVELVVPGCLQAALLEALPEAILHAAGDAHTASLTAAHLPLLDEAADRAEAFTPAQTTMKYPPLDDTTGPAELRVYDFVDRAIWDTA